MRQTDRLRELLDERGVEWHEPTMKPNTTWFPDAYGINCRVKPWGDALCVKRYGLTPERAIEATLGMTCRDTESDPTDFCCSECGARMYTETADTYTMLAGDGRTIIGRPNFCPNCGRKVVG